MKWNCMTAMLIILCTAATLMPSIWAKEVAPELQGGAVRIQDIIQDTSAYEGKQLLIEGRIETECPAGCWFIVNDGSASLYIDIFPSNFVIPQETGSEVKVYGELTTRDEDPLMIGTMVEINGEIYR